MARRPHLVAASERESRAVQFNASPLVGAHAGVQEISVELKFADPEGKQNPSPRGTSYANDMHAYFLFSCPMRDCTGGGFDANEDLLKALARHRDGHTGTLSCQGARPRASAPGQRCNIQLNYTLSIRMKSKAAA
jgi:hypothetical protein